MARRGRRGWPAAETARGKHPRPGTHHAVGGCPGTFRSSPWSSHVAHPLRSGWMRAAPPRSPYTIQAGTLIPAILAEAITSEWKVPLVHSSTRPVYDSITGQSVLIPQGARLEGVYDADIAGEQPGSTRSGTRSTSRMAGPWRSMACLHGSGWYDGLDRSREPSLLSAVCTAAVLSAITAGISVRRSQSQLLLRRSATAPPLASAMCGTAVAEDLARGMRVRPTLTFVRVRIVICRVTQDLTAAGSLGEALVASTEDAHEEE